MPDEVQILSPGGEQWTMQLEDKEPVIFWMWVWLVLLSCFVGGLHDN